MEKWELTEEHKTKIPEWNQKWIDVIRRTDPMTDEDRKITEESIREMYRTANLDGDNVHVVFVKSPLAAAITAGSAAAWWHTKTKVDEAVEKEIGSIENNVVRDAVAFVTDDARKSAIAASRDFSDLAEFWLLHQLVAHAVKRGTISPPDEEILRDVNEAVAAHDAFLITLRKFDAQLDSVARDTAKADKKDARFVLDEVSSAPVDGLATDFSRAVMHSIWSATEKLVDDETAEELEKEVTGISEVEAAEAETSLWPAVSATTGTSIGVSVRDINARIRNATDNIARAIANAISSTLRKTSAELENVQDPQLKQALSIASNSLQRDVVAAADMAAKSATQYPNELDSAPREATHATARSRERGRESVSSASSDNVDAASEAIYTAIMNAVNATADKVANDTRIFDLSQQLSTAIHIHEIVFWDILCDVLRKAPNGASSIFKEARDVSRVVKNDVDQDVHDQASKVVELTESRIYNAAQEVLKVKLSASSYADAYELLTTTASAVRRASHAIPQAAYLTTEVDARKVASGWHRDIGRENVEFVGVSINNDSDSNRVRRDAYRATAAACGYPTRTYVDEAAESAAKMDIQALYASIACSVHHTLNKLCTEGAKYTEDADYIKLVARELLGSIAGTYDSAIFASISKTIKDAENEDSSALNRQTNETIGKSITRIIDEIVSEISKNASNEPAVADGSAEKEMAAILSDVAIYTTAFATASAARAAIMSAIANVTPWIHHVVTEADGNAIRKINAKMAEISDNPWQQDIRDALRVPLRLETREAFTDALYATANASVTGRGTDGLSTKSSMASTSLFRAVNVAMLAVLEALAYRAGHANSGSPEHSDDLPDDDPEANTDLDGFEESDILRGAIDAVGDSKLLRQCIRDSWRMRNGGNHWASWCCYLSFVRDVVGWQHPSHELYAHYENATIHSSWRYMHKKFCIVSDFPTELHSQEVDGLSRAHREDGPAMAWSDGYKIWMLNGVQLDEQIVMHPETQTIEQIEAETNEEVKRIRIERFGWPRYIAETDAECLDSRINDIDNTMEAVICLRDGSKRLLCSCRSTGRVYAIGVSREVETCEQAQKFLPAGTRFGAIMRIIGAS